MAVLLELIIMPRTNSRSGWKWQTYLIQLEKTPSGKEIALTLIGKNESTSEEFEIKNVFEENGTIRLKTAYTVVSDNFYGLVEKYCREIGGSFAS